MPVGDYCQGSLNVVICLSCRQSGHSCFSQALHAHQICTKRIKNVLSPLISFSFPRLFCEFRAVGDVTHKTLKTQSEQVVNKIFVPKKNKQTQTAKLLQQLRSLLSARLE